MNYQTTNTGRAVLSREGNHMRQIGRWVVQGSVRHLHHAVVVLTLGFDGKLPEGSSVTRRGYFGLSTEERREIFIRIAYFGQKVNSLS